MLYNLSINFQKMFWKMALLFKIEVQPLAGRKSYVIYDFDVCFPGNFEEITVDLTTLITSASRTCSGAF